jgi:hypothetical protein
MGGPLWAVVKPVPVDCPSTVGKAKMFNIYGSKCLPSMDENVYDL